MEFKRPRFNNSSFNVRTPIQRDIRDYFRKSPKMNMDRLIRMRQRSAYRRVMRSVRGGGAIAARVHTFKRLGNIITLGSNGSAIDTNGFSTPQQGAQIGSIAGGNIIGTNNFGLGMTFALAQVAQFSEIQNLFDSYRIKMVKLRFDYSYNQAPGAIVSSAADSAGTSGTNWQAASVPRMHFAVDPDDGGAPADQGSVLANSYAKTGRLDSTVYCTIRPRFQNVVTGQGNIPGQPTGLGGLGSPSAWLDCNSPTIPHSGFKAWFVDMPQGFKNTTTNQYQWTLTITPTYYIECKNVV